MASDLVVVTRNLFIPFTINLCSRSHQFLCKVAYGEARALLATTFSLCLAPVKATISNGKLSDQMIKRQNKQQK